MELENETPEEDHDRRELLRRGALLAAGALGAGAAGAAMAPQAAFAGVDGDVVLGANNPAMAQTTISFNAAASSPLKLSNTQGAALTLAKTAVEAGASTPAGSLLSSDADNDGYLDLQYAHGAGGWGSVMTTSWETTLFTITPFRVLDTRSSNGRRNIVSGSSNLDGAGRLKAGTSIIVKLDEIFDVANAWFGNLTAVAPIGAGYAVVYPEGNTVSTSTVNFAANWTIANSFVCGCGFEDPNGSRDAPTVRIKAAQTTHLLLDISAADTWYWATPGVGASAFRSIDSAPTARLDSGVQRKFAAKFG
jgi:hypothetical protein